MKNSLIFEKEEIKKIKKLAIPVTDETEKATRDITELLRQCNIDNDILKEIKLNISVIRRSSYTSGVFKGLELERAKIIKWNYGN